MIITLNGTSVEASEQETILSVCRRQNIDIPTLCHIDNLFPSGSCRMCVVEIEGRRNLAPACATEVTEGMSIRTHSKRVIDARRTILGLLLADHPDDCLYCIRGGDCELQKLARELEVKKYRFSVEPIKPRIDSSDPAIVRDNSKCILCGRCVRICEEIMGVSAIDFTKRGSHSEITPALGGGLNTSSCIKCGQCIAVCPTGALKERRKVYEVLEALQDKNKHVVVQHAPSISVTLGEFFGFPSGVDVAGQLNGALRQAGFHRVFDTSFTADLTVMEEASELVERMTLKNHPLPLMTSCSPGWVKFVEQFYPELIGNLSSCKSPQQMMGSIIKSIYAEREGIPRENIYTVSIMPCTAKKFECERPELGDGPIQDIDAVLTTRECADLLKILNLNLMAIPPIAADNPFGERSSSGKLFGASGGVAEAAARTAHYILTGRDLEGPLEELRLSKGRKELQLKIDSVEVNIAVVNGVLHARRLLDELKNGRNDLHFIEVMTCPNGCIGGGGQPLGMDLKNAKKRMEALYSIDKEASLKFSHRNPSIQRLYRDYLEKPLSPKSHELLHTHYAQRKGDF